MDRIQVGILVCKRPCSQTVYYLLKHRVPYVDIGADVYEQKQREREVNALRKKAAKLGFALVTLNPPRPLLESTQLM